MGGRKIWTDEMLIGAVRRCVSMRATILALGLKGSSGSRGKSMWKHIERLGLDTSHWLGQGHLKGKTHNWAKEIPLRRFLKRGSRHSRYHLKKRLLREGLFDNLCSICGQKPVWHGGELVMVLDHRNGVNDDNRLKNLRLLCPNCNSQADTFCGRNIKIEKKKRVCSKCGRPISYHSKSGLCVSCAREAYNHEPRFKCDKKTRKRAVELAKRTSQSEAARKVGVSRTTIRRWMGA